jgi:hypothetical protein
MELELVRDHPRLGVVLAAGCDPRAEKAQESETERALPALAKPMQQGEAAREGSPRVDSAGLVEGDSPEAGHGAEPEVEAESPRALRGDRADRRTEPAGRRRASSTAKQSVHAGSASKTGELAVKRLQFSRAIAGREPVDPEQTFLAAQLEDVYAFVELANPSSKAGEVVVTFVPPVGKPRASRSTSERRAAGAPGRRSARRARRVRGRSSSRRSTGRSCRVAPSR